MRTEGVAVPYFRPPTPHQVHLVGGVAGYFWVPIPHQVHVLVHLVRLDFVEDDAVHVLAPSQDLREAALDLLIMLPALLGAVYQRREGTLLLPAPVLPILGVRRRRRRRVLLLAGGLAGISCVVI